MRAPNKTFFWRIQMNSLLKELVDLIFRFLTVQEATQIMHLCKRFNWAGQKYLERLLSRYNINNTGSLSAARRALTLPLAARLGDLYCVLSDLENFFNGEEWNISPMSNSRLQGSPDSGRATYTTNYLPLTIADDSPARRRTHFTTMTPDYIINIRGERFDLGHYLRWRHASGRVVEHTEVVDALELLHAIRELIEWLRSQRGRFLTLPDGTRLT
jgi:hypothetical protein